MKRYVGQIALGALLALMACELLLQALPVNSGGQKAASGLLRPFAHFLPRQRMLYSYGWALGNATYHRTNDEGFVNSHNVTGGHEVLIIGDSYIEGLMLSYPDTLQGQLDSMTGGSVVATAASGNGFADFLRLAAFYAPRLRPATTIVFVQSDTLSDLFSTPARGHNGFRERAGEVWIVHSPYREPQWKPLLQWSALGRYVWYNLQLYQLPDWFSKSHARNGAGGRGAVASSSERREAVLRYFFETLHRIASESGTHIMFLIDGDREAIYRGTPLEHVTWDGAERARFLELAHEFGCAIVDMHSAFERHWAQYHEQLDFSPSDGHWNRLAHLLSAEEISKQTILARSKCADGTDCLAP